MVLITRLVCHVILSNGVQKVIVASIPVHIWLPSSNEFSFLDFALEFDWFFIQDGCSILTHCVTRLLQVFTDC